MISSVTLIPMNRIREILLREDWPARIVRGVLIAITGLLTFHIQNRGSLFGLSEITFDGRMIGAILMGLVAGGLTIRSCNSVLLVFTVTCGVLSWVDQQHLLRVFQPDRSISSSLILATVLGALGLAKVYLWPERPTPLLKSRAAIAASVSLSMLLGWIAYSDVHELESLYSNWYPHRIESIGTRSSVSLLFFPMMALGLSVLATRSTSQGQHNPA